MTESILDMCQSVKGCFRWGTIITNSILLLVGVASVATAIWMLTAEESFFHRYHDVLTDSDVNQALLKDGVIVLLAGGVVVLTFAAFGMVAAFTANTCLLATYIVLLAVLMVIEIVPVLMAIVFQTDWISKIDQAALNALKNKYGDEVSSPNREFTNAFDALQSDFECCGWLNGSDYFSAETKPRLWNAETDNGTLMTVPESCCNTSNDTLLLDCVTDPVSSDLYFQNGCREAMTDLLETYEHLITGLAAVILGLELLTIVSMVTLLSFSVHNKYDLS